MLMTIMTKMNNDGNANNGNDIMTKMNNYNNVDLSSNSAVSMVAVNARTSAPAMNVLEICATPHALCNKHDFLWNASEK